MTEIRVTSVVGENGGDRVGLTTGLTVGPLTGTTGIGATITHHGHAQFAGVCTATSFHSAGSIVQIVQFTSDEQSITGGQDTTKINGTFNPKFSGSKFHVSVFIPNCTSGDGQYLVSQVYLGTSSTPSSNTKIMQFRQRMHGTSGGDTTCISAQDFGGFTCSSTGTHYASLVMNPTQNTVVARHSSNSNPTLIKLIVQEIAQ